MYSLEDGGGGTAPNPPRSSSDQQEIHTVTGDGQRGPGELNPIRENAVEQNSVQPFKGPLGLGHDLLPRWDWKA